MSSLPNVSEERRAHILGEKEVQTCLPTELGRRRRRCSGLAGILCNQERFQHLLRDNG